MEYAKDIVCEGKGAAAGHRYRGLKAQMCLSGDVPAYTGMTRARYLCVFWGAGVAEGAGVDEG